MNRTLYGPHRLTSTSHQKPHRGEGATPADEVAGNTATQPTTTPLPPGDDPGHSKGHVTDTGKGRRHGHSTQG